MKFLIRNWTNNKERFLDLTDEQVAFLHYLEEMNSFRLGFEIIELEGIEYEKIKG